MILFRTDYSFDCLKQHLCHVVLKRFPFVTILNNPKIYWTLRRCMTWPKKMANKRGPLVEKISEQTRTVGQITTFSTIVSQVGTWTWADAWPGTPSGGAKRPRSRIRRCPCGQFKESKCKKIPINNWETRFDLLRVLLFFLRMRQIPDLNSLYIYSYARFEILFHWTTLGNPSNTHRRFL